MTTREVIDRYYDCVRRSAWKEYLTLFSDDAVTALNRTNVRVEMIKMDDWGSDTVVEMHRGIGQAGGATLNVPNCTHYVIRAGRIAEVQVFEANTHEAGIYMWANYPLKQIPDRLA